VIAAARSLGLSAFPLLAAVIAVAFAAVLAARFAGRHRPHEGVWAVALVMFALGSAGMFLGVVDGWSPGEFRVYWLFGAILNVPFLAAGEVYLLTRDRRVAHLALIVVVALSSYAVWVVVTAPLDVEPLADDLLPLGREAFGAGTVPHRLAQYYAFPAYFFLLGGTVWSAWRMRGRPELRARAGGVTAIAVGATMVAIGSGVGAAFGLVPVFSVSLAAGVAIMFWGFLLATRPPPSFRRTQTVYPPTPVRE
jgi:hypothetical protein